MENNNKSSFIIHKYFPSLTVEQYTQLEALEDLYKEWNTKINVISRKDIDLLYERHVLHSMAIAKVISFVPGTKVLDVGTGGGFPGIPLAILFPKADFILVDSIGKKIKVVEEISGATGLKNVKALVSRAENIEGKFDFVVSRAVTSLPKFVPFVSNKISNKHNNSLLNGILYLKGGDFDEELIPYGNKVNIYNIHSFFPEPFFETKKLIYLHF